jgi:ribosomal protein S16
LGVRLRLRRAGRRNQPAYKIVAADSRSPRDGRFLEIIGSYNPLRNPAEIVINEEKVFKWLRKGALPTETVRSLLRRKGLWYKWHLMKKGFDEAAIGQKLAEWQAAQEAKIAREAERKARRKAAMKSKKAAAAEQPGQASPQAEQEPAA